MGEEELSTDRDGLEDEDYLNAVDRCQPQTLGQVVSAALEGAPVVLHEMSGAGRGEKRDRDRTLWRGVMGLTDGSRYSSVHCVAQKAISVNNMMR